MVWGVLLRFMGDLPEPALFARNSVRGSSAMRQIHGALGGRSSTRAPHGSAEVPGARVGGGGAQTPFGVAQAHGPWKWDPKQEARRRVSATH